jgi:hypothetical protein
VRISTRTQLAIGVGSVAVILLLLVIVLAHGGDSGLTAEPFDPGNLPSAHGLFLATVLAFTGYIGFEAAAALGEEAADPLRVIPRAVLAAITVGIVYYVFLAWVLAVGFGVDHVDRWATNPAALDALASRYAGTWLAVIVDLAVSVGAFVAALAVVAVLLGRSRRSCWKDRGARFSPAPTSCATPPRAAWRRRSARSSMELPRPWRTWSARSPSPWCGRTISPAWRRHCSARWCATPAWRK